MDEQAYWRVITMPGNKPHNTHAPMQSMKTMEVPAPAVTFINASDYSIIPKGRRKICGLAGHPIRQAISNSIQSITAVTKFNDEYNFTDKRLACLESELCNKGRRTGIL